MSLPDARPAFPAPRCNCCNERINPEFPEVRDNALGRVCHECAGEHLPHAVVVLAFAGLVGVLRGSKNNHPTTKT